MRRHVFIFIAGLATAATLSLWPFAACAQQDARVQGLLNRILRMQAEDAAAKIGQFIHEIEVQMESITAQPRSTSRLVLGEGVMRRVPAITELSLIDAEREPGMMVKFSRRADVPATSQPGGFPDQKLLTALGRVDAVGRSLIELAQTLDKRAHWGPIYFRHEREPYMTMTLTLPRTSVISVVEINLKPIQDMLSRIKLSEHAQANVIDAQGRLIFPDITLVLDNTNVTQFAQVRAARRASAGAGSGPVQSAKDILGRELLTAYAPVGPLGWLVFVELPIEEVNALAQ
jgi:hypothetical protein